MYFKTTKFISMKKKLIEIYLYLCKLFRKVKKPEKILDKMNLSMFDFCKQLNSMEYKYDKIGGLRRRGRGLSPSPLPFCLLTVPMLRKCHRSTARR